MGGVSIVIPVFNEEESIRPLYAQIAEVMEKLARPGQTPDFEVLFVDDGSTDASVEAVRRLHAEDARARLIAFRKNFGKAAALQAGFRACAGDVVLTMDADLQDDPSEIPNLLAKLEEGYGLVSGWRFQRRDPLEKRLASRVFNFVTAALSGVRLRDFNGGFKAYRREAAESLELYGELHRYIPVLAHGNGFKIAEIKVRHNSRRHGKSKYGSERYLSGFLDLLTVLFLNKYSAKPMHFFGRIGFWLTGAGGLACAYPNARLLPLGLLLIVLGAQLFCAGFLGEALVRAEYRREYRKRSASRIKEKL